jgi:hypothetical protein
MFAETNNTYSTMKKRINRFRISNAKKDDLSHFIMLNVITLDSKRKNNKYSIIYHSLKVMKS